MPVLSSAEDLKKRECLKSLKELFSMSSPPTSTELQRSYSDMGKFKKFLNDTNNLLFLVVLLRVCPYCQYKSGDSKEKLCGNLCYMESLGIFDDNSSAEREKLLLGRLSNYIFDTSCFSLEVSARAELLDRCAEDLSNRESALAKRKVGRKSKFDARRWYYDTYWKNVSQKPSYRELGAIIGVSHTTVKRDLIELGYIINEKNASDGLVK